MCVLDHVNVCSLENLIGCRFGWVVDGFFLGGTGGGEEEVQGTYYSFIFRPSRRCPRSVMSWSDTFVVQVSTT
jgi:hypothetical protein